MNESGIAAPLDGAPPSHEVVQAVPVSIAKPPEGSITDTPPNMSPEAPTGESTMLGDQASNNPNAFHVPVQAAEVASAAPAEELTTPPISETADTAFQPPADTIVGLPPIQESGTGIDPAPLSPTTPDSTVAEAPTTPDITSEAGLGQPNSAPEINNHGLPSGTTELSESELTVTPQTDSVLAGEAAPKSVPQPENITNVTELSARANAMQEDLDRLKQDIKAIEERAA